MHHPTDRIAHTTAFVTPVVEHWLEREIAQWVHHEGSIRRPIAPWANTLAPCPDDVMNLGNGLLCSDFDWPSLTGVVFQTITATFEFSILLLHHAVCCCCYYYTCIIIIICCFYGGFFLVLFLGGFLDVAGFVCFFVGLPTLYFFDLFPVWRGDRRLPKVRCVIIYLPVTYDIIKTKWTNNLAITSDTYLQ